MVPDFAGTVLFFTKDTNNHHERFESSTKKRTKPLPPQQDVVDVSLDLIPYMTGPLSCCTTSSAAGQQLCVISQQKQAPQQDLNKCPSIIGSRCSTQCGEMLPAAGASASLEEPPCKRCRIEGECSDVSSCSRAVQQQQQEEEDQQQQASELALARSNSSSTSSSSSSSHLEFDESFVRQCYFGDPSSAANKALQRPKPVSPFAAFANTPGYRF